MTQVSPATHSDVRALDRFLRDVEPRALQMADLALASRADAIEAVGDAIRAFRARHVAQAGAEWPVLFWSLLDGDLEVRGRRSGADGAGFAKRVGTANDPRAAMPDPVSPGPFMQWPDATAMPALDAALRTLPAHQRQAFLLRVREDLDAARSARVMRLSEAAVRTHLVHALRNLRAGLRIHSAPLAGSDSHDDGAWILRCRVLLDGAARVLGGAASARVTPARQTALVPEPTPRGGRWLVRAGGLAIVAGAALALSRLLPPLDVRPPPAVPPPVATPAPQPLPPPPRIAPSEDTPLAAPDFDLLLDADDPTLLEDLEFYAWLAAEGLRDG